MTDQSAAVSPLTVAADDVADFAEHGTGALPAERAGMRRLVALVEAIEDDPAAFWPMITRAQALALLGAAPRVAGEWVPDDRHGRSGARYTKTPVGSLDVAGTWVLDDRFGWHAHVGQSIYDPDAEGTADTLDAAKAAADAALVAAGWVLE